MSDSCLCAFDIDDTLTCPKALGAVQACTEDLGCDIAIVTARPKHTFCGVHPAVASIFQNRQAPFKYLPDPLVPMQDYGVDLTQAIAMKKKEQLEELRGQNSVVLFFDDVAENVSTAQKAGFTATHVECCNLDREMVLDAHAAAIAGSSGGA